MPVSLSSRHGLLRARISRFGRLVSSAKGLGPGPRGPAWLAARQLRVALAVLQLDRKATSRLALKLRRFGRRLRKARDLELLLALIGEMEAAGREAPHAVQHVLQEIRSRLDRERTRLARRKLANEVRRSVQKLRGILRELRPDEDPARFDAVRDAVRLRIARRANAVKAAIASAGSVYLSGRIRAVSLSLQKLRLDTELGADISAGVDRADARAVVRLETLLARMRDTQGLINLVRDVQGTLPTPDLATWHEFDTLALGFENRARMLHARYIRQRAALLELCDRLILNVPASEPAKRKVG